MKRPRTPHVRLPVAFRFRQPPDVPRRPRSAGKRHPAATVAAPFVLVGMIAFSALIGCAGARSALFATPAAERISEAATLRRRFVVERSPEAIRTLLREHLERGMTLDEVRGILGEPGERVFDDTALKRGSPLLHQSDTIYRWGPDRNGRSYYLAFRDGKLVHFPAD